jgi:hypothetical protein
MPDPELGASYCDAIVVGGQAYPIYRATRTKT